MKSRSLWFLVGLALAFAAAVRFLRRRTGAGGDRQGFAPPARPVTDTPESSGGGPAGELRRRIEESRTMLDERDAFESAETPVDEADPDLRRREIHERARATVERMRVDDAAQA